VPPEHPGEVGVRSGGPVLPVVADGPAHGEDVMAVDVVDEGHHVRHPRVDAADQGGDTVQVDRVGPAEVLRVRQTQLDGLSRHLGVDNPRPRLEGHPLRGNPPDEGETRRAPAAVAAHLHLAAVGVEETPAEMRPVRALDEDEPVGPHGHVLPADILHELVDSPDILQGILPVVDENEIVPAALDFVKLDHENLFEV